VGQRPYRWGWALALVCEAWQWDDQGPEMGGRHGTAGRCDDRLLPLLAAQGHSNSVFGLSRALGCAQLRWRRPGAAGGHRREVAHQFGSDMLYPGGCETSGHDFLSPALTEAELMAQIMPQDEFAGWLSVVLPGIASGEPRLAIDSGDCLVRTPTTRCRTSSATITWSRTSSPATPFSCSA